MSRVVSNTLFMAAAAALVPPAFAKSSGSGMGGMYWAIAVIIILVIGMIGYVIFQYWKAEMLKAKMAKDVAQGKQGVIASYEDQKLAQFNSRFQRDLDLASKKAELTLHPDVALAVDMARAGERKKVFDLIDSGACDVNCTDSFGRTLLMIGAEIGDSRLCDGMLRRGADINLRNKFNGATVLHFAYQYEHDSLGMSLVARGADDTVRAIDGRTCYQLRDEQYDVEAGGSVGVQAPAPRREMKQAGQAGQKRKTGASKGGSRRVSGGRDKMGDPYDQPYPGPGVPDKYRS